jgi:stage V sporulation protein AA
VANTIYIRLRHRIMVQPNHRVTIGDLAQIITVQQDIAKLEQLVIHQINMSDKSIVIIDLMHVLRKISGHIQDADVQTIGPTQTIVEVMYPKKKFTLLYFIAVWFLLFIGSALAIMNFHEDVSMQQVHQRLYTIITGNVDMKPLLLQIPYSIGLGVGMILYFNHLFKKRLNEEPSPLEVEMFNYQQDLDQYVIMNENKESLKQINDD